MGAAAFFFLGGIAPTKVRRARPSAGGRRIRASQNERGLTCHCLETRMAFQSPKSESAVVRVREASFASSEMPIRACPFGIRGRTRRGGVRRANAANRREPPRTRTPSRRETEATMSDSDAPEYDDGASPDLGAAATAGMDPDHPLLARAQLALKKQLLNTQREVDEKIRKRREFLDREKKRREDVGVELYSAQQTLARLQMQLQNAEEEKRSLAERRLAVESDLARLQEWQETRAADADARRAEADARQAELDRLNATLKRLEAQTAATREETSEARQNAFAAEKETKALEKAKLDQDVLIDALQETLKKLHEKGALYDAQRAAQAKETKLARQTLAEANAEMDAVTTEKKQLTSQWKSALVGDAKRDEALRATRDALMEQTQEMLLVEAETNAKKEQAREESRKNERLLALLRKTETEAANVSKALTKVLDKKEKLAETHERLVVAQEETDAALERAKKEESDLADASRSADESVAAAERAIRELDEKMLANLSEQSTTEKDARRVVESTREIRRLIDAEETSTTNVQNEIARIRVDILHHRSLADGLSEAAAALEEEAREKTRTVETYESEIARREDEIQRKGMEVERLNRELDKRTSDAGGSEALGPMEANIKHLARETEEKEKAIKELQRSWVGHQTELVALVNENNNLAEKTRRLKAEVTVASRRRARLTENLARQKEEIKELDFAMERARGDAQRINAASARNEETKRALVTDVMVSEKEITGGLKEMEQDVVALENKVETASEEKKRVLAEVIECERQIMLWERKIQLEKETQAALDPDVGGDVVGAMKKEINRMTHRSAELARVQEALMRKVEQAVYKRETVAAKARLAKEKARDEAKSGRSNAASSSSARGRAARKEATTKQGLKQACVDLKREIKEIKAEISSAGVSVETLAEQKRSADEETAATLEAVASLRAREEDLRDARDSVERERERVALEALKATRMLERFRELDLSDLKPRSAASVDASESDFDAANRRREKLRVAVEGIRADAPHLETALERAVALLSV